MKASLGITPIISVVLLVAIAASAAALIAVWQCDFLSDYIDNLDQESRLRLLCDSASISLDSAAFDCNNDCSENAVHTFTADVRNAGDASLELQNAFLLKTSGEIYELVLDQSVSAGSSRTITIENRQACEALPNNVVEVIIPTQCSVLAARLPGENVQWVNC